MTKGELLDIIKDGAVEALAEWRDDHRLSTAEIAKVVGHIVNRLDDAGVVPRPGDLLLSYAAAHGEGDGT